MIGRRSVIGVAIGAALGTGMRSHITWAHPAFGVVPPVDLRYRDTPLGEKSCVDCAHFLPAMAGGLPHCTVVAGPVSTHGYCVAWQDRNPSNSC